MRGMTDGGSALDGSARFSRKDDVIFREIAGETVLVPLRSGVGEISSIFTLNEVGATIWRLLDADRPLAAVAAELAAEFEVSQEKALADVTAFAGLLAEKGFVVPR